MKIAIIGATGTAGRAATRTARQAGYDVITLSRATGIDLHTGRSHQRPRRCRRSHRYLQPLPGQR